MSKEASFRRGRWTWRVAPTETGRMEELTALIERRPADARPVKTTDGRRSIWTATIPGDGVAFVKRYTKPRLLKQLKALFRNSRTRQEWEMGRRCEELGLPVARHLAMAERRRFGLLAEDYLIQEALEGFRNFDDWFRDGGAEADRDGRVSERRDAVIRLARLIRRLHHLGVVQRDFKPDSVMVGPDGAFKLVDLERALVRSGVPWDSRLDNLAKLDQTFAFIGSAGDRLRFLREYFMVEGLTRGEIAAAATEIARRSEQLARKEAHDRRAWAAGNNMIYRQFTVGGCRVSAHYEMPRTTIEEAVNNLGAGAGREFRCEWKPGLHYLFRGVWCEAAEALGHVPALQYRKAPFVPARAAIFPPGSTGFGLLLHQVTEPPLLEVREGYRQSRVFGRGEDYVFALAQWVRVCHRMGIWWRDLRPDSILYDPNHPGLLGRFIINRLDLLAMDLRFSREAGEGACRRIEEMIELSPERRASFRQDYARSRLRWFREERRY